VELQQIFPLCALAFRPMIEFPDPTSRFIAGLNWNDDDESAYHDLREAIRDHGIPESACGLVGHSKLFGWPDWVQYESEQMAESNKSHDLNLLLQLDAFTDEPSGPNGAAAARFIFSSVMRTSPHAGSTVANSRCRVPDPA
jgi:hypothetical protein